MRLLKDEFDGKALYHQLVAAYLPGQGISISTIAVQTRRAKLCGWRRRAPTFNEPSLIA